MAAELLCQEVTINEKALFLREFEKWLIKYLQCIRESGKDDVVHQILTAFHTSMKASADYHQRLSELDKGSEIHNNIARIYSVLAKVTYSFFPGTACMIGDQVNFTTMHFSRVRLPVAGLIQSASWKKLLGKASSFLAWARSRMQARIYVMAQAQQIIGTSGYLPWKFMRLLH